MLRFTHILCDFDGTLVDSYDGILMTLRDCIQRARLTLRVEPSRSMIGPPLADLIEAIVGPDRAACAALAADFRAQYDERGYLSARPYAGIREALGALRAEGAVLHIVSNKRLTPLLRILDTLGWRDDFTTVSTLDSTVDAGSKSDVVSRLMVSRAVPRAAALLVGDSQDDRRAAFDNGVAFAWASWGYGQAPPPGAQEHRLAEPRDLIRCAGGNLDARDCV